MTTSVASVNPRLISAVSPDPAVLLAAASAELAHRWASGDYDLDDIADRLADDGMASRHAAKRAAHAGNALKRAVRELARALDCYDDGFA